MSAFVINIGLALPSTCAVVRPLGQTSIQRPAESAPPSGAACIAPESPRECIRKRKYDWTAHPDAPIRPTLIARPDGWA
jgi:hypothetical protein